MLAGFSWLTRLRRPSATVKAPLLLSFLMLLAMLVATTVLLLDLRQRELAHAEGEIVSLNRILSEQSTRTFDGVALVLKGVQDRLGDSVGQRLNLDSLPVTLLLQTRAAGLPQVKSVFVVDRDGFGVNSSRADFIRGLSMKRRSFFSHFAEGATDALFISAPEKARVDNQWTFYVSTRLLDADGQLRGLVVAAISIEYFESLYGSISLDAVNHIRLLNNEGMLLAGQPHDDAGFGLPGIAPEALAELRNSGGGALVRHVLNEGSGHLVAYSQVKLYPLMVSVAVDEQEALAPWRRVAQPIVAGVALVSIFILLATFFMVRNLLRREALESDLKGRDEQLRYMVQSAHDAIVTIDAEERIVLFNRAAEKMFGIAAAEVVGAGVPEWLSRSSRQPHGKELQRFLHEAVKAPAGSVLLGVAALLDDRQEYPVELTLSTAVIRGQPLVTAVFRDLAESRRAERELVASNRQLKDLSASLQNVREEERARIARELHDELGQMLTGMRMEVSWLGGRLPAESPLAGKVNSIKGLIDQTIVSVRRISSELRPLVLDDLGFPAAAGWYVDQFSARTGLRVRLELPDEELPQDEALATALFRVMQESLTNVARHAGASEVDVRLARRGGDWLFTIRDNGIGFAQNAGRSSGIGLIGMRERVHILGGSFSIVSAPGEGTIIEAVIPLP